MISTLRRSFCLLIACTPVLLPLSSSGQSSGSPPAEERGWGSTWVQPATPRQRELAEAYQQYLAAQKARHYAAEVAVSDRIIQKQPDQASWHVLRAEALVHLRQFDRATADLDRAQTLAREKRLPALAASALVVRSWVHRAMGDDPAAAADLDDAVKTDSHQARAWNDFAWLRATSPDAAIRDGRASVRLAQKAIALQREATHNTADTLAAAYAEAGDYPRAVETEQRALVAAAKEIRDPNASRDFQKKATERLSLFEQHQPYHAPFEVH